ncbi:DUF3487 family protein [Shewanella sp. MBTL60-007]|uniref:DUF3487 family protein n=1 Tax=Shewanella sp. MBTL60-007 TaxID=2815911 RepID=UPI001BC27386|nr:DUF3487 family protein [Shewanella sp. MBTL60-007]GIU20889.1 hypothetical protein TUM3792_21070 [Shewanella sp. MBTL60-007]
MAPKPDIEINNSIELLDFEPTVWAGLTQDELLYCVAFAIVGGGVIPLLLIGLITGVWWLGMAVAIFLMVLLVILFTRKLSSAKETRPDSLVWVDFEMFLQRHLNTKTGHFVSSESFEINLLEERKLIKRSKEQE